MPTRNVVLTDHQEKVIESLVRSGRYEDASDVMREGLRLLERREAMEAAKLKAMQDAARVGFADLDDGRFDEVDDDALEGYIAELGREAGRAAAGGR